MIYIYTLKKDDLVVYVGATVKTERRLREHKRVHGEVVMDVIEECSLETVSQRELYWICYYKEINPSLLNKINSGHNAQPISGELGSIRIDTKTMDLVRLIKKHTGVPIISFIGKAIFNEVKRLPKSVKEKMSPDILNGL